MDKLDRTADKADKADKANTADRANTPRAVAGTLGAALGTLFMVGAITFGATAIRPTSDGSSAQDQTARADRGYRVAHLAPDHPRPDRVGDDADMDSDLTEGDEDAFRQEPKDEPADEPKEEPADEPKEEPAEQPADDPKEEPADEPKDEPKDEPNSANLELGARVKEGKVKLSWSKFGGDGFAYYKVVRSTDAQVTWPTGSGDQLVAAISDRAATFMYDGAPCGTEFHYRVFAVKHSESGYLILASSNVVGALVECHEPEPDPEPTHMAFAVVQSADGVHLSWEQCTAEGFVYYKVVRSATNENPLYPLNDGTELLAAIGDAGVTQFVDGDVEAGQTWFYRVLSLAETDHGWVVAGMTDAVSITVD